MPKLDLNQYIVVIVMAFVLVLGITIAVDKYTTVNLTGPISIVVLFLLISIVSSLMVYILFNLKDLGKQNYLAIFIIVIGVLLLGYVFNGIGYLPKLFSAGVNGLQSMLGL